MPRPLPARKPPARSSGRANAKADAPAALTEKTLAAWPPPELGEHSDKEARGQVLLVAGSYEMPGAALLAGVAALRTGAGKLTIAAPARIAQGLSFAIPEARVISLVESPSGGLAARGIEAIGHLAARASSVVLGPGMVDEQRSKSFVARMLPLFCESPMVLDAYAMSAVIDAPFRQPVILTPHAGEMAHLTGLPKEAIEEHPLEVAREAAARWNAIVVMKGTVTFICRPDGTAWRFDGGSPGLGTSGSGDTLAGLIGGFLARGMAPVEACGWGVTVHGRAGEVLARRMGPLGYLARELPGEVPALIHQIQTRPRTRRR
ncbi:ADP-dependent (S)-NAD(P)H-hydrate dehydratase [Burkholderiales bacterium 8X]|nr:ADP-dependent (S)-NAD(P)H-hydrate dehydratase [Burkholderiales bacterium 8X]